MQNEYGYLIHSQGVWKKHKYIAKKMKDGKMRYIYKKTNTGGWDDGERDKQKWTDYETSDGKRITTISGSNSRNKYVGIGFGNVDEDAEYFEKTINLGKKGFIHLDNEVDKLSVSIHINHESVDNGKTTVKDIINKLSSSKKAERPQSRQVNKVSGTGSVKKRSAT